MGQSVATRQKDNETPSRVNDIMAGAVTSTASQVTMPTRWLGRRVVLYNDSSSVSLYYSMGAPGTTPTPAAATTGGPDVAGVAQVLPPNQSIPFRLRKGTDGVLGLVTASSTTTYRLSLISEKENQLP